MLGQQCLDPASRMISIWKLEGCKPESKFIVLWISTDFSLSKGILIWPSDIPRLQEDLTYWWNMSRQLIQDIMPFWSEMKMAFSGRG